MIVEKYFRESHPEIEPAPTCGGSALVARSGTNRRFRRLRLLQAAGGDDRISALPDDLLLLVLRRVDSRTALRTGLLSSRWARLPRELPALDLRVGDILPRRYRRWVLLHSDIYHKGTHILYRLDGIKEQLMPNIRRYQRRAMRALSRSVNSLLDAQAHRKVDRLRLEFFITHNTACMNRLISKAMDAWGISELEAVAKPTHWHQTVHTFPSHGLCQDPRSSSLRSLKLGGCLLPPLHDYNALSTLVLHDIPELSGAAYECIFTSCTRLLVLHLDSCSCTKDKVVVVDAPSSEIRELVVHECKFSMCLRALPKLESLASIETGVHFESTSFPCLRRWNLARDIGVRLDGLRQYFAQHLELDLFLECTPDISDLIIRFTGPDRWIEPSSSPSSLLLPNLRRLLVADVPSSWDVSWPRLLLEVAPSLEIFHIHIAPCMEEPGDEISWQPAKLRRHHLKEFVMAGFEGTERQIYLVKFVMGVCTALRRVALFKSGHALDKGHWDWEMVTQQSTWSEEEKGSLLEQITDGVSSSTAPVQLNFG
ncbi:FBD-associated F-box protein At1g66310-like [Aegilops tauschii subsp. strangulata]|uniref:FBD-associated F-box protein At1g66310-like n=1 Tax=Aegilops tauschii subsp. strangulata TaxID=200361 RepID=UPI00098AC4CA|nr:uncharacterized protein LOC109759313 [Aegilops tauschii subsp. strangulata]